MGTLEVWSLIFLWGTIYVQYVLRRAINLSEIFPCHQKRKSIKKETPYINH